MLPRRPDAAGAGVDSGDVPAHVDTGLLDIGDPAARRLAIRVAHVVAKDDALAANFAAILQVTQPRVGSRSSVFNVLGQS